MKSTNLNPIPVHISCRVPGKCGKFFIPLNIDNTVPDTVRRRAVARRERRRFV